mgnify:CR=1 FL=1
MTSHRSLPSRSALFNTVAAALVAAAFIGCSSAASSPGAVDAPRADIIRIDGLKQFGRLERPAVVFLHEKHTQALAPKNKDCAACHLAGTKYISTKFMRLKDDSKQQVMDLYHAHCTDCHRQTTAAGEKSGPVVCAGCHAEKPIPSSWAEIGMDKSLHYRHVKSQENKCEACHHQFDPTAKKLFYAKGKEETCRYCHLDRTVENVTSFRQAAHEDGNKNNIVDAQHNLHRRQGGKRHDVFHNEGLPSSQDCFACKNNGKGGIACQDRRFTPALPAVRKVLILAVIPYR